MKKLIYLVSLVITHT